jgi:hypothetical protein
MFNLIEELFSPGRRHTEDERRRLDHTRVEEGSNDPGHGPVDLTSGHVLIRIPEQRSTATTPSDTETGRDTATDEDSDRSRRWA